MRLFSPARLLALAAIAVVGTAGYGAAAANTAPKSSAGDGHSATLAYTIVAGTTVYTLNPNSPQQLDQVTFTLSAAPAATSKVRARVLNTVGATWYSCTFAGANVTCDTTVGTAASALTANQLRVVVVD